MRKRSIPKLLAFFVLCYVLYVGVVLSAVPKYLVFMQAITTNEKPPSTSGDWLFYPIPRWLYWAHWEFNRFQECNYLFEGNKDSYLTFLSYALLSNRPDETYPELDAARAEKILRQLLKQGCSINEPMSDTGWLPIHFAVVFANQNPEMALFIAEHSVDWERSLPDTDPISPGKSAHGLLEEFLEKRPKDESRLKLQAIYKRITSASNPLASRAATPQSGAL